MGILYQNKKQNFLKNSKLGGKNCRLLEFRAANSAAFHPISAGRVGAIHGRVDSRDEGLL